MTEYIGYVVGGGLKENLGIRLTVPSQEVQEGAFTAAMDGLAWDTRFLNVWNLAISADGGHLAAEVRLNLYEYTIAVDGQPWNNTFSAVWKPVFEPGSTRVTAPVKIGSGWFLARDGEKLWDREYVQLWHHRFSPDGGRIAAIVAPWYGRWTVAVDDEPWLTFTPAEPSEVGFVFYPGGRVPVEDRVTWITID